MKPVEEPTTIGLSEHAHSRLGALKEDGHFAEMADAYRFAIALALSQGVLPDEVGGTRRTVFNIGTIDPDKDLYVAIKTMIETGETPVYRWAERLAEWGVVELARQAEAGSLDVGKILEDSERQVG